MIAVYDHVRARGWTPRHRGWGIVESVRGDLVTVRDIDGRVIELDACRVDRTGWRAWVSPEGVTHAVPDEGPCATCGKASSAHGSPGTCDPRRNQS